MVAPRPTEHSLSDSGVRSGSTEPIIDHPAIPASRRDRILDAAARAFAAHGYRASSLRDIAKEADCSLTLLDHHFGGKGLLLEAVVKQQHDHCHRRLAGLKALLAKGGAFDVDAFIAMWVNYEFDLYETREGRQYIALMLRLSTDSNVDAALRRDLNCSEALVLQALARARPGLAEGALRGGWFVASGGLYAAVVNSEEVDALDPAGGTSPARLRTIAFVAEGLRAYWRAAPAPANG